MKRSTGGFTLVEVMVVIVIMTILASLILLNISGTDHRKALQSRELWLLDIQRIIRESNDQSKVLALVTQPQTDVSAFQYSVVEYLPNNLVNHKTTAWQAEPSFKVQSLPKAVYFEITPTDYVFDNPNKSELLQQQAPKLIFLGNGEVKPVRVQFYVNREAIGAEINIDHLGGIHER